MKQPFITTLILVLFLASQGQAQKVKDYSYLGKFYEAGDFAKCLKKSEKALSKDRKAGLAYLYKSMSVYELREDEGTLKSYRNPLREAVNSVKRGKRYDKEDNLFDAQSEYFATIQKALFERANNYLVTDNVSRGNKDLELLFDTYDNSSEAYTNYHVEETQQLLYRRANVFYKEGNAKDGDACIDKMMSIFDNSEPHRMNNMNKEIQEVYFNAAKAFYKEDKLEEGDDYINRLLEKFNDATPETENLYREQIQELVFIKAKSLYDKGDFTKANGYFSWIFTNFEEDTYRGNNIYKNPDYTFKEWAHPKYRMADTAGDTPGLSNDEKEFIYLQNLLRMNPKLFKATYLKKYRRKNPTKVTENLQGLEAELAIARPTYILYSSPSLNKTAAQHASDIGRSGGSGHKSSGGKGLQDRLVANGHPGKKAGENIAYGQLTPIELLVNLLIDEGVEDLGHRKTALKKDYHYVGVAIKAHSSQGKVAVVNYSAYTDKK